MSEGNKPIKTIQKGAAKISVWENEGKFGKYLTFKVEKVFKQTEGKDVKWVSTNSFKVKELAMLGYAINEALTSIEIKEDE